MCLFSLELQDTITYADSLTDCLKVQKLMLQTLVGICHIVGNRLETGGSKTSVMSMYTLGCPPFCTVTHTHTAPLFMLSAYFYDLL
jgi:hypothetical protein